MKRFIPALILSVLATTGYAQNTILGLFGGVGTSLNYNYDVGMAGGFTFLKPIAGRTGLGADLFYNSYGIKYDKEAYSVTNGAGNGGVTILNQSSYIFLTPKINQSFGYYNTLEAYVTVGAGFKMGGKETMRKWDRGNGSLVNDYDSTIDTSPNINSMVFRLGCGLTEYIYLGGKWWFTVTEDFGFIPSSITKTSDPHDPSRTQYSPAGKLNPYYISLFIGIAHTSHVSEKESKGRRHSR